MAGARCAAVLRMLCTRTPGLKQHNAVLGFCLLESALFRRTPVPKAANAVGLLRTPTVLTEGGGRRIPCLYEAGLSGAINKTAT